MKFKTTQREIKENYKTVISVPYCGLQNLLNYKSPVAYTVRREGWAADIYDMGNGLQLQWDMRHLEMFVRPMNYGSVTRSKPKKFAVFRVMKKR